MLSYHQLWAGWQLPAGAENPLLEMGDVPLCQEIPSGLNQMDVRVHQETDNPLLETQRESCGPPERRLGVSC